MRAPEYVDVSCPLCGEEIPLYLLVRPRLTVTSSDASFVTAEVECSGSTHYCAKIKGPNE